MPRVRVSRYEHLNLQAALIIIKYWLEKHVKLDASTKVTGFVVGDAAV